MMKLFTGVLANCSALFHSSSVLCWCQQQTTNAVVATELVIPDELKCLKVQFAPIYTELFTSFQQQIERDVESGICIHGGSYSPLHAIMPAADLIDKFNQLKVKVIELATLAHLTELCHRLQTVTLF